MMKNKLTRMICLLLAFLVMIPLVGCNTESPRANEETTTNQETEENLVASTPMNDYGMEGEYIKIVESLDIPTAIPIGDLDVNIFSPNPNEPLHGGLIGIFRTKEDVIKFFEYSFEIQLKAEAVIVRDEVYDRLLTLDFEKYQIICTKGVPDMDKVTTVPQPPYGLEKIVRNEKKVTLLYTHEYMVEMKKMYAKDMTVFHIVKKEDLPPLETSVFEYLDAKIVKVENLGGKTP